MKPPRNRLQLLPRGVPRCARNSRWEGSLFPAGARLPGARLLSRQQQIPVLSWRADSFPIKVIVKT